MSYYDELTQILERLKDVRTVCGLRVELQENIPITDTVRQLVFNNKVRFLGSSNALIFFEEDVINYENEIAVFIFNLTAELSDNLIAGKLPGNNLKALYEKLDQHRSAIVSAQGCEKDLILFTEIFIKLQTDGFIAKKLNPAEQYEACLTTRLFKRLEIILLLKDKIIALEESIISNSKAGSESISDGPVNETCIWKIAWLKDIGLMEAILLICGKTETAQPNWAQAAKVISEFTGEKSKSIEPYLRQMGTGERNDPIKSEVRNLKIKTKRIEIFGTPL